jgi:phage gp29-like protein
LSLYDRLASLFQGGSATAQYPGPAGLFGRVVSAVARPKRPGPVEVTPRTSERVRQVYSNPLGINPVLTTLARPDETSEMRVKYRTMMRDESVKVGLLQKVLAVAQLDLIAQPADKDDPRDRAVAEFTKYAILKAEGGMPRLVIDTLLSALVDGVSLTNIVLRRHPEPQGKWAGKRTLRHLRPKDPGTYNLITDDYLNVIGVRPTREVAVLLDPAFFVIFSYLPPYGHPAGTSDLRAAWRYFILKDAALKLRAIFTEKYTGGPFVKGKYPFGNRELEAQLKGEIAAMRASGFVTLPEGTDVEIINLAVAGEDVFKSAIADYDRGILISLLGSYLHVMEGQESDTRGNTQVHQDVAELFQWYLQSSLAAVWTDQLVPAIVDENFLGASYPTLKLSTPDPAALKAELDIDQGLYNMGVPLSLAEVYERYNRSAPKDDDKDRLVKVNPAAAPPGTPPGGAGGPPGPGPNGKPPTPFNDPAGTEVDGGPPRHRPVTRALPVSDQHALAGPDGARASRLLAFAEGDGARAVRAACRAAVRRAVLERGGAPLSRGGQGFFSEDERRQVAEALAGTLAAGELLGRARVRDRLAAGRRGLKLFAEGATPFESFAEPVPGLAPARALEYFRERAPGLAPSLDPAAFSEAVSRKAFGLALTTEAEVTRKVYDLLEEFLATGRGAGSLPDRIDDVLDGAGVGPRNRSYSELVMRTNAMDAFTEGTTREMQDPEVRDEFPAWRYLGIRDGRQGKDHEPHFDRYYPNSTSFSEVRGERLFNCRCCPQPVYAADWEELLAKGARFADFSESFAEPHAHFTGVITDRLGRKRHYEDGRQVKVEEGGEAPHQVQDFYGQSHTVTGWPADWGLKPGIHKVWRGGDTDTARGAVFVAPDQESAMEYAGKDREVNQYHAEIKNPYVAPNQYEALADLTGKTKRQVLDQRDRAKDQRDWLRKADKKIAQLAAKRGHDAVTYTRPMLPALRELSLLPGAKLTPVAATTEFSEGGPPATYFGAFAEAHPKFTGMITDKMGRKRYYVEGKQVAHGGYAAHQAGNPAAPHPDAKPKPGAAAVGTLSPGGPVVHLAAHQMQKLAAGQGSPALPGLLATLSQPGGLAGADLKKLAADLNSVKAFEATILKHHLGVKTASSSTQTKAEVVQKILETVGGAPPAPTAPAPAASPPGPVKTMPTVGSAHVGAGKMPASLEGLETVSSLGGSTGAKLVKAGDGKLYVMKTGASPEHVRSEAVANQLYYAAGVDKVPRTTLYEGQAGKHAVQLTGHIDGKTLGELAPAEREQAHHKLRQGFAADALLGNWDVVGAAGDNVLVTKAGSVYRVDNGGALAFRAQGAPKGAAGWGPAVPELNAMRDPKKNPQAAAVFGKLSDAEVAAQVTALLGKKHAILAAAPDDQLRKTLAARLESMAAWAAEKTPPAPPAQPKKFLADVVTGQVQVQVKFDLNKVHYNIAGKNNELVTSGDTPPEALAYLAHIGTDHAKAINAYTDGDYGSLNKALRENKPLDPDNAKRHQLLQEAFAHAQEFPQPAPVSRGYTPQSGEELKAELEKFQASLSTGAPFEQGGYMSTSTKNRPGQIVLKIAARKAIDVVPLSFHPSESEILLNHGSRFVVKKIDEVKPPGKIGIARYEVHLEQVA